MLAGGPAQRCAGSRSDRRWANAVAARDAGDRDLGRGALPRRGRQRGVGLSGHVRAPGRGRQCAARRPAAQRSDGVGGDRQHLRPQLVDWLVDRAGLARTPAGLDLRRGPCRACAGAVLAPLPQLKVTWSTSASDRFPTRLPDTRDGLPAPARRSWSWPMRAEPDAAHLILTLFPRSIWSCATGCWAHGSACRADRIGHQMGAVPKAACAIWATPTHRSPRSTARSAIPSLGKHPQAIAVGVAARLLAPAARNKAVRGGRGMSEPLLSIEGLTKAYPGVVANDDVSFDIAAGRGARPAGRERRRQIDAGQDDLRAGETRSAAR